MSKKSSLELCSFLELLVPVGSLYAMHYKTYPQKRNEYPRKSEDNNLYNRRKVHLPKNPETENSTTWMFQEFSKWLVKGL